MKQNTLRFFIIIACIATSFFARAQQDTMMGRKAITLQVGYSITYPILFSQYQYNTAYYPSSGAGPQISASYNYSFINHRHSVLGIKIEAGYFQYHYLYQVSQGNANLNEFNDKAYLGGGIGLFMIKRMKKLGFYSEVNILGKTQVVNQFSDPGQQLQSIDLACDNSKNIYLNFQSGISLYFVKNFVITPYLAYPVFEISNIALWFPSLVTKYTSSVNNLYYSSFGAGVNFAYYL